MSSLSEEVSSLAEQTGFAGVVSVTTGDEVEYAAAFGLAHRGLSIPNTVDTRFAIASGTKGLTALTVMSLVTDGKLALSTPVRSILGADLPMIDDTVTVEHLLSHRSGIGEWYSETGDVRDYLLPVPAQNLLDSEQYLGVLDGHPQDFAPGTRFTYNNGGYVVLGLIAERVSGTPFHSLVVERVCEPAGMTSTEFLRSDTPESRTALGYVEMDGTWRTNVFHLPIRGAGDGGIYSTVDDFRAFWPAFLAGAIVPADRVASMIRPHSDVPEYSLRYGLGFWLRDTEVMLEGYDSGVSFQSAHNPTTGRTYTVMSNTTDGAWPIARHLAGA
ncbi:serine hydrolase domain-containing protein [Actinocrispum wychmicini]|uniref:CubicO group peptidase (Beta-lactamase class C family) n=1 Tax=Actinocrispum wychmicini TaxID=1213861 RepID=A0A4R2JLK8_9PSEU|nr:serine hydrolase domain-containing protein [Actinocrispum wychmicini]TCO57966.1 CubicO group peptidase (beta-lactamase class C family) [Actinocrispum wychmicini]